MGEWYGGELAYIPDAGFGGFVLGATPGILEILRENEMHDGLVVDLGCGSGLWARELTDAGYDALFIDIFREIMGIARRKAPDVGFRVASLFEAGLPPCVAVTSIGEVLNYLFDPENDETTLAGLFRRVYGALVPGSVFVRPSGTGTDRPGDLDEKLYRRRGLGGTGREGGRLSTGDTDAPNHHVSEGK